MRGGAWIAVSLALASAAAMAQPASPRAFIVQPPPLRWDNQMLNGRPAVSQSPTDFANLTGGFRFGMNAAQVNARLPSPISGLNPSALPLAAEFPGEIRYLRVPLADAGSLRTEGAACAGAGSGIVFLFNRNGLFRISYRLLADRSCVDTNDAARATFARYVSIGPEVAISVRYRTGSANAVDITDPTASFLIPIRWNQGGG